jgi:DNA invertase Pin-like site-specific DNA recombinase
MIELPCVIYAAKSTEDLRGSIGTQLEHCRRDIDREGRRRVRAEHTDEAASAFRGNRGPGLVTAKREATRLASEHGSAELWVQHSDRLAQGDGVTADHLAEVFFELRRADVQLRSVYDDATFTNPMLVAAIGERNREDSARKSVATRAGKRRRWGAGKVIGGPVHDGYKLAPELDDHGDPITERDGRVVHRRVIDPERAPLIGRMFDMIEAGHTPGDAARALNGDGLTTVRGKDWTARRVRDTIRNPYYGGWITAYGARARGDHEPLINPDRLGAHQRWPQAARPGGSAATPPGAAATGRLSAPPDRLLRTLRPPSTLASTRLRAAISMRRRPRSARNLRCRSNPR